MALAPGYGETPVPDDELDALLPAVIEALEEPISKAAIYDTLVAIERALRSELVRAHLIAARVTAFAGRLLVRGGPDHG